jgi:hypothetical protein
MRNERITQKILIQGIFHQFGEHFQQLKVKVIFFNYCTILLVQ